MTIADLIALAVKRLVHLTQLKASAESLGDVATMAQLDSAITETEATVDKLRSLPS